jgi:hypothetical protein
MVSTPITMPKKSKEKEADDDDVRVSQVRAPLKRYRVLVDRQMKSSFDKEDDATKVAAGIKKAHPIVTVSVYDAEKSSSKDFE